MNSRQAIKGSRSISEYVLIIRAISNSLLLIDDPISRRDEIDAILQGVPEDYNSFIMMIYEKGKPNDIYYIESLLYMQEAQLDMYQQELDAPSAKTKIAQASSNLGAGKISYNFGTN